MLKVALTGGIASGKSTVSAEFEKLGVPVIDADIIAREVVEPGNKPLARLVKLCGKSILRDDGSLNRPALRQIIFSDSAKKKLVEDILHPAIRQRSDLLLKQHEDTGADYCIYVIPLLLESGQTDRFDRVLVVDVPIETQIERVMTRDSASKEEAESIILSQVDRSARLKAASDVINNTGTLDHVRKQVLALHRHYSKLSKIASTRES